MNRGWINIQKNHDWFWPWVIFFTVSVISITSAAVFTKGHPDVKKIDTDAYKVDGDHKVCGNHGIRRSYKISERHYDHIVICGKEK